MATSRWRRLTRTLCTVALLISPPLLACTGAPTDDEKTDLARSQAEQLLESLRRHQWAEATDLVLLNDAARSRFGLPADIDARVIAERVEELFRRLYERNPPGPILSIRIDPRDTGDESLAIVSYRHGDIDGFHMRLVDDRWLYSFE